MSHDIAQRTSFEPVKRGVGQPKKVPPANAAQLIELAAASGAAIVGIAKKLSVAKETLGRWFDDHPELRLAFELGREAERQKLHDIIMRDAMDGEKPNVNAMFLLKCRHGYREGDQGDQGARVNVIISLPGAMSRDEFMKTVIKDG